MKTAQDFISKEYGFQAFNRTVNLKDTSSLFTIMEDYADTEVKAFHNDLKQFSQANPKATVKQMLKHFNI